MTRARDYVRDVLIRVQAAAPRPLRARRARVSYPPAYLVATELARGTLARVFTLVTPAHDFFRSVYRADDPRQPLLHALAATMREAPLR